MRVLALCLALLWPAAAAAGPSVDAALDGHVLPRVARLAEAGAALSAAAEARCAPEGEALRAAYHAAYDAWAGVSHLRFGPMEEADRGYALAFWPDTRGATARSLARLLGEDPALLADPAAFATVSVAARGLLALERLLYDAPGAAPAACGVIRAVSRDIAGTAAGLADAWALHAPLMRAPGPENALYASEMEVLRTLFTAVATGLEFNADVRLGRPMGSFERPRPLRAEAHRSGRSLRIVRLSLAAIEELALALAVTAPAPDRAAIAAALDGARGAAAALDDPVFAGVATPQGRFRVEALQQRIRDARAEVTARLGPALGVSAGFNALDGD
ncbi:imelysin family protein [Paralimibaculum aggregatum]|uniref:Imelysin family protein n=1 Tax=Paralimibaculum aggregatum TaxID=3036245 RepID=A0ABQ6LPH3_9RHOB|nr:imelysin family protein [Limibaculum sp. NKW23]GMG82371.1 imelysin family protein [Limibaculum sp. NKW23]